MEGLKIATLCVAGAIVYGILHDLVTAHLCVQYFSLYHPDIFGVTDPVRLALGWGIVATWWMGLIFGSLITAAARVGDLPKLTWDRMVVPICCVFVFSYACAAAAGLSGARHVELPSNLLAKHPALRGMSADTNRMFMVDWYAHRASYAASAAGAMALCGYLIYRRTRLASGTLAVDPLVPRKL